MEQPGKPLAKTDEKKLVWAKFQDVLAKTNKENPRPADLKALTQMLHGNKSAELWRAVASAGQMAELTVIDNATSAEGIRECWKQRLQSLKKELGSAEAPMLEQLLIQHTALCWLRLGLTEITYSTTMKQSITLTLGIYWEKRLSAAQKRFTRSW